MLMLLMAGAAQVWAGNVKFIIVNNKGNKVFNYTIDTSTLQIHEKAKSVFATNFRFYTTEEAAVANATLGTAGTYYAIGDAIGGGTGGHTGPFYVRYDCVGTPDVNISGEKLYRIKVRDRNGKWWYIYYDGNDQNKIKLNSAQSDAENYAWKFESNGDPYDVYITNVQGSKSVSGGTLTALNVEPGNANSNKQKQAYITSKITSDYNQSASRMNLQSFFFTKGTNNNPGFAYQNGWSSIWNASNDYQLVGAYNGIDYSPKNGNPSGSNEYCMAYYICANNSSNGQHLQVWRSWRSEDPSTQNISQIQLEEIRSFTFHVITRTSNKDISFTTAVSSSALTATLTTPPAELMRKYVYADRYHFYTGYDPSEENYDDRFSGEITTLTAAGDATDIYITYEVDESSLPFATSTDYEHAHWYRMAASMDLASAFTHWSGSQYVAGVLNEYDHDYQYAFYGDPYDLRVANRAAGEGFFLGVPEGSPLQTDITNISSGLTSWEIIYDTDDADFFQLRSFGTASSPVYAGYTSGTAKYVQTVPMTLHVVDLPKRTYTYHIIDNDGRDAIYASEEQYVTTPLTYENLPEAIRSPYIKGETLTGFLNATDKESPVEGRTTYSFSNPVSETPVTESGTNTPIYIRYTTNHLTEKNLRLNGKRSYNVKRYNAESPDDYIYAASASTLGYNTSPTSVEKNTLTYVWDMVGNDPYAVKLKNTEEQKYFKLTVSGTPPAITITTSLDDPGANTSFVLLAGGDPNDENRVKLTAAVGSNSTRGDDLIFEILQADIHYYIIDKQEKMIIDAVNESGDLLVPTSISSPLVAQYHYYKLSDFIDPATSTTPNPSSPTVKYRLDGTPTELSSISDAVSQGVSDIYVTYDVNDVVDLQGRNGSNPKTYMLKFLHGQPFKQEDGSDGVMGVNRTAVYPYSNGDAGLYVYGQERWNLQLEGGASTRTRWLWYLESPTLVPGDKPVPDPYHVKISSLQTQTQNAAKTVNYHSYLRTYKPDGYSEIVTGVTNDNPLTTGGAAGDPANNSLATEYMILGAPGHAKLVTVNTISDGSTNVRRTVTSFEQYWKNSPTVEKIAGANPAADNATLTGTYGWHAYNEFANSAPWGGGTKSYGNSRHWFQTISMGYGVSADQAGEFTLEEVSLTPVLILLDLHGWEIARINLPSGPSDPNRAARYADIRKYNSPMAKRYHYWKTGTKVPGYHKYTVDDYATDDQGNEYTTPQLGVFGTLPDYETQGKVSGGERDWYVTYDVKDEYASTYQGASTQAGTVASTFFIKQDGNYATTTNGTNISGTTAPANFGAITDNMLWYLKPNFNIDRELGYLYSGETGAKEGAQTKLEMETDYFANGQNGFDPYNVQIQNKQYNTKYFTTNATTAALSAGKWTGNGTTVSLSELHTASTPQGYDQIHLNVTNSTFMVIDDGNGNMRLMPRFDQGQVVASLTTLDEPDSPEPANDTDGEQTFLLGQPATYVYHIVNNSGDIALTYREKYFDMGLYTANLPSHLRAFGILDENFKYYDLSSFDNDALSREIYRLAPSPTPRTTFSAFNGEGNIYVKYTLDTDSLSRAGIDGAHSYNIKLKENATPANEKYLSYDKENNLASAIDDVSAEQLRIGDNVWRLLPKNGDPYDIKLYSYRNSATPLGGSSYNADPTTNGGNTVNTFALICLDKATKKYELLLTNSADASTPSLFSYLTVDDSGDAKVLRHADHQHIDTSNPLNPSPVRLWLLPATLDYTYKLYDLTGQLALQGTVNDVTDITPSLPEFMQSPLVGDGGYHYWQDQEQTVTLTQLSDADANIVYVTYDPLSPDKAEVKLDGSFLYTLHPKVTTVGIIFSPNINSTGDGIYAQPDIPLRASAYGWSLNGREVNGQYDPYDITVYLPGLNQYWSSTMRTSNGNPSTGNDITRAASSTSRYMILKGQTGYYEIMQRKVNATGYHPEYTGGYQYAYLRDGYVNNDQLWTIQDPSTHVHGSEDMQFRFQPAYIYHVVNMKGRVSVSGIESRLSLTESTAPVMPIAINSPLVKQYHFYDVSQVEVEDGVYSLKPDAVELTELTKATSSDIFAFYTRADLKEGLDLSGRVGYNMRFNPAATTYSRLSDGGYVYGKWDSPPIEDRKLDRYLWRLVGEDPYELMIYNMVDSSKYIYRKSANEADICYGTTDQFGLKTFMLTGETTESATYYHLMSVDTSSGSAPGIYKYQYLGSDKVYGFKNGSPNSEDYRDANLRVVFEKPRDSIYVTYVVINKSGQEAIRMKVKSTPGIMPIIPVEIRSPYATNFHYYSAPTGDGEVGASYMTVDRTIYVRNYDLFTEAIEERKLVMDGATPYNLWMNGMYIYDRNNSGVMAVEATPNSFNDSSHEWYLKADDSGEIDPYNVRFNSTSSSTKWIEAVNGTYDKTLPKNNVALTAHTGTNDIQSYILMDGSQGYFELLAATGANTFPDDLGTEEIKNRLTYLGSDGLPRLLGVGGNDNNPVFKSGMSELRVRIHPAKQNITYHIVNLSGVDVVRYTVQQDESEELEVPAAIRSPFVKNWKYYSDAACTSEITEMPSVNADVYVTYTYDDDTRDYLQLDGQRFYNMTIADWYVEEGSGGTIEAVSDEKPSVDDANSNGYLWAFDGNTAGMGIDPYNLHLLNKESSEIYVGAPMSWAIDTETTVHMSDGEEDNFRSTFFLVGETPEGPFELVAASGANITDNVLAHVARTDGTAITMNRTSEVQHGNEALKVQLESPENAYIYKVRNKSGEIAIVATGQGKAGDAPEIPSVIASPLVSRFYYNVTELPYNSGLTEIIVTYDFDEERLMLPNLLGSKKYNLKLTGDYFASSTTNVGLTYSALENGPTENADYYVWQPTGNVDGSIDPYDIKLKHYNGNYMGSSAIALGENALSLDEAGEKTYQSFILLEGTDGRYEFMAATKEAITNNMFAYLGHNSETNAQLLRGNAYNQGKEAIQIELIPFKYVYTYVVINNDDVEALRYVCKQESGDYVKIPEEIRSPLIDDDQFQYYKDGTSGVSATADGNYITAFSLSGTPAETEVLPEEDAVFYVKYTYTPKSGGLNLENLVKYQIANPGVSQMNYMHKRSSEANNTQINNITTSDTDDQNLWRLAGNDPYNVKITSASNSKTLMLTQLWHSGGVRAERPLSVEDDSYAETNTDGQNNSATRFAILGHEGGNYRLMGLTPFFWKSPSEPNPISAGNERYYPVTGTWSAHQQMRVGGELLGMNAGAGIEIMFIPATKHNYRFHLTTKIDNRQLIVKRPMQMAYSLFELPEELKRKYCTYTVTYYVNKNSSVNSRDWTPKTKESFDAAEDGVEAVSLDLYSGTELFPYFTVCDGDENAWVDIYVDYTVIPHGEAGGIPFRLMAAQPATVRALLTSMPEEVFDLSTYEKRTGSLASFGLQGNRNDYLYFLVMKTNNTFTNDNGQYFLRREDNGRISWLNNDFKIYQDKNKNYKGWTYSRCAEAYRENDHDPFQEKKWLWCFAGDPYDLYIFNVNSVVEEVYDAILEQTTLIETHRDHLVGYREQTNKAGTLTEYVVNTPSYSEVAPSLHRWGLAEGQGANSDATFSLVTSEFNPTGNEDEYSDPTIPTKNDQPLYWKMAKSGIDNMNEVMLSTRETKNTSLDYNIQALPYVPTKFENLRFVLKRDDLIGSTTDEKAAGTYLGNYPVSVSDSISAGLIPAVNAATKQQAASTFIDNLPSGTVRLYASESDRMFAKGDMINALDAHTIPLEIQRKFCDYTFYGDDYRTPGDYTVKYGPIRGDVLRDGSGDIVYNAVGKPMYNYYAVDEETGEPIYVKNGLGEFVLDGEGNKIRQGAAPQTIYGKYEVTSDIFLKKHPTKEEVEEMVANNDHVYFMDFADPKLLKNKPVAYNTGHHAYYDEVSTYKSQIGRVYAPLTAEKRVWNGTAFVDDTNQPFNNCQFKTTSNRMESTPENLKWYFVGDPYNVQVYCTEDPFNEETVKVDGTDQAVGTIGSNLCRYDPSETNFQFVVDCVHMRVPDETLIDTRRTLSYEDVNGNIVQIDNHNYNKPYYPNFYWEVVPTVSDDEQAFALRFRADNQIMNYRDVYYYLAHDGLKRTYKEAISENPKAYSINLSYDENNTKHLSGQYSGYHSANNEYCVITLSHPAKVYVSAYKENFKGSPVVQEELSEYFALGETLTEVPRHLQRKFVKYGALEYNVNKTWNVASFDFTLSKPKAFNLENCASVAPVHTMDNGWVFKLTDFEGDPTKCRASFKLRVTYEVDDVTLDDIHLFTTEEEFADVNTQPQWLDIMVGDRNWLFYDKTNIDNDKDSPTFREENQTTLTSNYPQGDKDLARQGWDIGMKGLHWAFIGDPYEFTVINRRRWEDMGRPRNGTGDDVWLGTGYATMTEKVNGISTPVYYNYTQLGDTRTNSAYGKNGSGGNTLNGNTLWSLQMCKTGKDSDYFMRTASRKTTSVSDLVGDYANNYEPSNMTNDYQRLTAKTFNSSDGTKQSSFVLEEFELETLTKNIQKVDIRTAVGEDEDRANNDCFDANVRIYNVNGELKASLTHVELKYANVYESLPPTLKRFGCNYIECYQISYTGYTDDELANESSKKTKKAAIATQLQNLNNFTGDNKIGSLTEFIRLSPSSSNLNSTKMVRDENDRRYYEIAYVYEMDEEISKFFTTEKAASEDEYYWSNASYQWDQVYKGSNVRVISYESVFDHYEYNSDGHIVNEVYVEREKVEYKSGDNISTPAYGWLNTHNESTKVYGDESTQSEDNRQKWALVGDPYDFELKNYALYLDNAHTAVFYDSEGNSIVNSNIQKSHWAIAQGLQKTVVVNGKTKNVYTDANGDIVYEEKTNGVANTPVYVYYLALIDDDETSPTYGNAINYVTFDRATDSKDLASEDQYLYLKGAPVSNDPTASTYTSETKEVRPFYITELQKYANMVVYHLVIAHQHSLDYEDTFSNLTTDEATQAKRLIDKHLLEWLKYKYPEYMVKNASDIATDQILSTHSLSSEAIGVANTPVKDRLINATKTEMIERLKSGSLRDVVNDSIEDYIVQRVGIGNALTVPWYMKRQFCKYTLYQRDVMRSVTSDRPVYEEADAAWISAGKSTYLDGGVYYKVDFTSPYADPITGRIQKTFEEDGITKRAYEIDWTSVLSTWDGVSDETKPRGYDAIQSQNGKAITRLDESHLNRMVVIDVVYDVDPEEFRFAEEGRNTTAWYTMMTNNDNDGLMNFSYKDGIGARYDRSVHYTNNYLWAPEGDPYGFVMHSRYATVNGTGWDNVVVTTTSHLPDHADVEAGTLEMNQMKKVTMGADYAHDDVTTVSGEADAATYTGDDNDAYFVPKRIIHFKRGDTRSDASQVRTWGERNAVYEMFVGINSNSFLMHPTSAFVDVEGDKFSSFYMLHNTSTHRAELQYQEQAGNIRSNKDANWRLMTTPEQLLPYFERSGYVGGLKPSVANSFEHIELYNTLRSYLGTYRLNPSVIDFKTIDEARKLVYAGDFYKHNDLSTPLAYTEPRPTLAAELPLRFVPRNLVNLQQGYYRLQAFSTDALTTDGANINGIVGPRYISGYRFESEKLKKDFSTDGSLPLHFLETNEENTTLHTFGELNTLVNAMESGDIKDRRTLPSHPAMRGNIEILPVEYDPSSIFYFQPLNDAYDRFKFGTQNLYVNAAAGVGDAGYTKLSDTSTSFQMNDVGGTAVTIRTMQTESSSDNALRENLKTNYLSIDADHRYEITAHTDNEMEETGDQFDLWATDGSDYTVQNTLWLLQPVGTQKEWPYNEMPLRVKVNKGQQRSDASGTVIADSEDNNYYTSLYVPYDTRLGSTIDVAFTNINANPMPRSLRLSAVSLLNNTGNPQFIPAGWPVVIRTSKPERGVWMNWNSSTKECVTDGDASKYPYYIELDLPNAAPTVIADNFSKIRLYGEYLEKKLTNDEIDNTILDRTGVAPTWTEGRDVMVFGLPFVETGDNSTTVGATSWYAYQAESAVGFYSNENWYRGHLTSTAKTTNDATEETAHLATARNATADQRRNKYVYHNKVYLVYDATQGTAEARPGVVALFGDEEEAEERPGIQEEVTRRQPWPCPVYDLQGRRVAENETPQTLLQNHPQLTPGIYIFGGHKVVVKRE